MKIKKYCVDNIQEGMQLIKKELGPDAIIIQSRKVRERGWRGFFTPPKIEITAAADTTPIPFQAALAGQEQTQTEDKLQKELGELKQLVSRLVSGQQRREIEAKGPFYQWMQQLIAHDVEEELAQQILAEIHDKFAADNELSQEVVAIIMQKKIREKLRTEELPDNARILVFVGPTGVGKTTTLAKLAARFAFYQNKKVGMITIDTYRVGAVDQLRTYADITGMPVEVVMAPKEMAAALEKLSACDIILVDTAGRNAKNTMQVSELAGFLSVLPAPEIFLVLSATTKTRDLYMIMDKFSRVNYNRLIFTKLDETTTHGVILNVCAKTNYPVTYITTGQNVPDDLEVAHSEKLANLILGG